MFVIFLSSQSCQNIYVPGDSSFYVCVKIVIPYKKKCSRVIGIVCKEGNSCQFKYLRKIFFKGRILATLSVRESSSLNSLIN